MVHTNKATANFCSAQVVDGQIGAPLVLVLEPPKALGLARLFVADELQKDGFSELGEYGHDIAFR